MQCEHCGTNVPPEERVCPVCRAPMPHAAELPLNTIECLVTLVVGLLPLVGTITLGIWAFGHRQSRARRSLSRALLIVQLGVVVLLGSAVLRTVLVDHAVSSAMQEYEYYFGAPDWSETPEEWGVWPDEWTMPAPSFGTRPMRGSLPHENCRHERPWKENHHEKDFECTFGRCAGRGCCRLR